MTITNDKPLYYKYWGKASKEDGSYHLLPYHSLDVAAVAAVKRDNTTVKELIQILEKLPEGLPVLVDGYKSGYEHFYAPRIQKLKYEPQNSYYNGEYQPIENEYEQNIDAVILQRMLRDEFEK